MKIKTNASGKFHWAKRIIVLFATLFLIMSCGDSSDDGGGTTGGTGDDGGGGVATTIDGVWKLTSLTTCQTSIETDVDLPMTIPIGETPFLFDIYVKIEYGVVGFYAVESSGQTFMAYCDDVMTFNVEGTTITDTDQNGFTFVTVGDTITITADDDCDTIGDGILEIVLEKATAADITVASNAELCNLIEPMFE